MKILLRGREVEIDERTESDNCDLDLEISEILGLTEDQVDEIALETVELLREVLWRKGEITMKNAHAENMQNCIDWVDTCPYNYSITSMQGGFLHVKIQVPYERTETTETEE